MICVSSVTASLPAPGLSVYTATKAAIEGWAAVARYTWVICRQESHMIMIITAI